MDFKKSIRLQDNKRRINLPSYFPSSCKGVSGNVKAFSSHDSVGKGAVFYDYLVEIQKIKSAF
jgi:hypothetical protein